MLGFCLTSISALIQKDWKNSVVAIIFTVANGVIFLWKEG